MRYSLATNFRMLHCLQTYCAMRISAARECAGSSFLHEEHGPQVLALPLFL